MNVIFAFILLGFTACSAERTQVKVSELNSRESQSSAATEQAQKLTIVPPCSSSDLARFDKIDGDEIDIARDALPRGMYLATLSELLIEKKAEQSGRLLARESLEEKQQAEIVCSENVEILGDSFELSLSGAVKFDTISDPGGGNLVSRQFLAFANQERHGVVISSTKLADRSRTFKQSVTSGIFIPTFSKIDERHFVLKLLKERDGIRARLLIHLEMIPQN
jgi:hypothetical protein